MTNRTFISSGTDPGSSTRISLCHSGFKGLAVSSVRGIVTFNTCRSYCLDSSWTLTFLTYSPCSPVFPHQGGKYMEIHGNSWNSGKFGQFTEFFMSNTCLSEGTQANPNQGYPSDANSHRDKGSLNSSTQAKPAWGAAQARCNSAALPCDYIIPPVALVQQSSGTEWQQVASSTRHMQQGSWAASLWHADCLTQKHCVWHLSSVRSSVRTSVEP